MKEVEVAIVGGGPAGLSAALVLGRCRRRVVLYDGGHHRNDQTGAVHGFLTRDGIAPRALRDAARDELRAYPTVELRDATITDLTRVDGAFVLVPTAGEPLHARRVLLATGVRDVHPPIDGVEALHGRRVVPCPYCDGWEHRDQPLGAYGHPDDRGARYAMLLGQWSRDVTLYGAGPWTLSDDARTRLAQRGIAIDQRPIVRLTEDDGGVRLWFADATSVWRAALFYHLGCEPGNQLARQLGAPLDDRDGIVVDRIGATPIAGLYAAGDATRDALQAIVGAGEGAAAAIAIDRSLTLGDWPE